MLRLLRLLLALPERLQWAVTGGPTVVDGQRMDGPSQLINAFVVRAGAGTPIEDSTPAQVREWVAGMKGSAPPLPVGRTEDRPIEVSGGTIRSRVYWPNARHSSGALVWLHGGGWVIGDLESHDPVCAALAARAGILVVSVEYRLAPEHTYPTAVNDAYAGYLRVLDWADELGVDPEKVAVGGDSAGGNLAAALCMRALRDGVRRPPFQLLVYPATDLTRETESHRLFAEGFFLTTAAMRWFIGHYVPDPAMRAEPECSVLLAEDLSEQPPAHVVIAGFDPLRDEGRAYAARLVEAGVEVSVDERPTTFHGFFSLATLLPVADAAVTRAADALRRALT